MVASSYANNHAGKVTDLQSLQGIPQTADKVRLSIDLNRHKPSCANLNLNPPDFCLYISSHHPSFVHVWQVKWSSGVIFTQNKKGNAARQRSHTLTHAVTVNIFDLLYTVAWKKVFMLLNHFFLCYWGTQNVLNIWGKVQFVQLAMRTMLNKLKLDVVFQVFSVSFSHEKRTAVRKSHTCYAVFCEIHGRVNGIKQLGCRIFRL